MSPISADVGPNSTRFRPTSTAFSSATQIVERHPPFGQRRVQNRAEVLARSGAKAVQGGGRSRGRAVAQSVGRSLTRAGRRSAGRPGGRAVGWSVDRAVAQSGGRSLAWAGGWSVGRSVGRTSIDYRAVKSVVGKSPPCFRERERESPKAPASFGSRIRTSLVAISCIRHRRRTPTSRPNQTFSPATPSLTPFSAFPTTFVACKTCRTASPFRRQS